MTSAGDAGGSLDRLFAAIDAQNTDTFLGFVTADAVFRFGSAPPVSGREAIRVAVDGFFSTIAGSRHELIKQMHDGETAVCEGEVTYRRHDGSELTLPFTNVFEFDGDMIREYKIYIDIAPLYAT